MTQHTTDPATTTRNAKDAQIERLNHNLTNHPPVGSDVVENFEKIRFFAKELGATIIRLSPVSREQSLALTSLEQTVMWAVASIARNQTGLTDSTSPV